MVTHRSPRSLWVCRRPNSQEKKELELEMSGVEPDNEMIEASLNVLAGGFGMSWISFAILHEDTWSIYCNNHPSPLILSWAATTTTLIYMRWAETLSLCISAWVCWCPGCRETLRNIEVADRQQSMPPFNHFWHLWTAQSPRLCSHPDPLGWLGDHLVTIWWSPAVTGSHPFLAHLARDSASVKGLQGPAARLRCPLVDGRSTVTFQKSLSDLSPRLL